MAPQIIKGIQTVIGKMHPDVHKTNTQIHAFIVRGVCDPPGRNIVSSDVLLLKVRMGVGKGPQIF